MKLAIRFSTLICIAVLISMPAQAKPAPRTVAATPPLTAAHVELLVRSVLMTLHDANSTGNYTVLRDLGINAFRARTAADLATVLGPLRLRNLDLTAAATAAMTIDQVTWGPESKSVTVSGHCRTRPEILAFKMSFETSGKAWQHAAIIVALHAGSQR